MCMEHYVTVIRDNACFQALTEEEAATGKCAQPCRMPYDVYDNGEKINNRNNSYALSLRICVHYRYFLML